MNQPAVTIRVRVIDGSGLEEMRKVFYVSPDDDIKSGFPYDMGASGESSPILVDLTDDGVLEVLIGTADGEVLALYGDGTPVEGWPVAVDTRVERAHDSAAYVEGEVTAGTRDSFIGTVAAGDIDGDGRDEIIGATLFGGVYAWRADGKPGRWLSLIRPSVAATTSWMRCTSTTRGSRVHPRYGISTGMARRDRHPQHGRTPLRTERRG